MNELLLQDIVLQATNRMLGNKEQFLSTLEQNITTVIKESDTSSIEEIDKKLEELQKELLKLANNKSDYDAIANEIFRLRELKKQSEVETVQRDDQLNRITQMHDFIIKQPAEITGFNEH